MPHEPSVAKLTLTVPQFCPRSHSFLFSFHLCWHLNENHITLSHPLTGSFGTRTNHSLTSTALPLSIKPPPHPGFILISTSFPLRWTADERLTQSRPAPPIPTAAHRYGPSVDTLDDLLDAADRRTLVFLVAHRSLQCFLLSFVAAR